MVFVRSEWLHSWSVFQFFAVLSWNTYVYQKWQLIFSYIYWSDGVGERAFDCHSRNVERGICQRKMPAGPGIWPFFFKCPGSQQELTCTLCLDNTISVPGWSDQRVVSLSGEFKSLSPFRLLLHATYLQRTPLNDSSAFWKYLYDI